jgi:hypothetical protein
MQTRLPKLWNSHVERWGRGAHFRLTSEIPKEAFTVI